MFKSNKVTKKMIRKKVIKIPFRSFFICDHSITKANVYSAVKKYLICKKYELEAHVIQKKFHQLSSKSLERKKRLRKNINCISCNEKKVYDIHHLIENITFIAAI